MLKTLWTRHLITSDKTAIKQIIDRLKKFKIKTYVETMKNGKLCIWTNYQDYENVRKKIKSFALSYLKLKKGVVPSCMSDGKWFIQINTKNSYEIDIKNGKYIILDYHQ